MEKHYIPGTKGVVYSLPEGFSFGVDSILLSAFSKTKAGLCAMDICSGTGMIALRNALLYEPKNMVAIELLEKESRLIERAAQENGLDIKVHQGPFQSYGKNYRGAVDILTCNPPYIKKGEGVLNANYEKNVSRHEIAMQLEDVFIFAREVLVPGGKLYLIHRPHRLQDCAYYGRLYRLSMKRLRLVLSKEGQAPKMILMEFRKDGGDFLQLEKPLILYEDTGKYTEEILRAYEGGGL